VQAIGDVDLGKRARDRGKVGDDIQVVSGNAQVPVGKELAGGGTRRVDGEEFESRQIAVTTGVLDSPFDEELRCVRQDEESNRKAG
jgi:hypothetical protein